mgnify:CR=1 FL=1
MKKLLIMTLPLLLMILSCGPGKIPDKKIVELKSLKLYLQKYRNVGMFHESVVNKILEDFQMAQGVFLLVEIQAILR